ncbi:MAG: type 1 glutamine amidotransferase [FCB group bacterium]|nr:type 1 glutamine amidotransferase [FCB group bacterium]
MKPILIIQNCKVETAGTILDFLENNKLPYKIVHTYKNQPLPPITDTEAVINLGCPYSVINYYQHDFLKSLYQYIAENIRHNKPYLGICFGGQILAQVLGAKVEPCHTKEIGIYQVKLNEQGVHDPFFKDFDSEFPVFQWHGDTFHIPLGAKLLVEGSSCQNQAFRHGNMLALQFHLEASLQEIPLWCDTYRQELVETHKTKNEIITTFEKEAEKIKKLNYKLLDNFLGL